MSRQLFTDLNFGGAFRGVNVVDPTSPQDVATKGYVDGKGSAFAHVLTTSATVAASTGAVVPRYLQLDAGAALTLESGATLVLD